MKETKTGRKERSIGGNKTSNSEEAKNQRKERLNGVAVSSTRKQLATKRRTGRKDENREGNNTSNDKEDPREGKLDKKTVNEKNKKWKE